MIYKEINGSEVGLLKSVHSEDAAALLPQLCQSAHYSPLSEHACTQLPNVNLPLTASISA